MFTHKNNENAGASNFDQNRQRDDREQRNGQTAYEWNGAQESSWQTTDHSQVFAAHQTEPDQRNPFEPVLPKSAQPLSGDIQPPYYASPAGIEGRTTALYQPQSLDEFFQQEKQAKRKSSKSALTRSAAAAILTLAVVLSGAAGAGSVLLTSRLVQNDTANSSSTGGLNTTPMSTASGSGGYSVEAVAETAADSVVEITTEIMSTGNRMQQMISEGAGSGVIISQDGKIVTNHHVIEGASKITVRLRSGETYPATLLGTDSKTDVALLKIEASNLPTAVFGDSDTLRVGQPAVAIGNPLGQLGGTVTNGIISALNRDITIDGETMNLLQTNAAINPGNSGGGLFDANGSLIGIVVAKSSGTGVEGLGFAIPINQVKAVVEQLHINGYVTGRVELGVSLVDIQDAQTAMMYRVSRTGVYVLKVSENSAAEQAGLQSGDCIAAIDGEEISNSSALTSALDKHAVGDVVTLQVIRNGQTMTITAALQEQKPAAS